MEYISNPLTYRILAQLAQLGRGLDLCLGLVFILSLRLGLLCISAGKILSPPISWFTSAFVTPGVDIWHALLRSTPILRDQPLAIALLDHLIYVPYWTCLQARYYAIRHPLILFLDTLLSGLFRSKRREKQERMVEVQVTTYLLGSTNPCPWVVQTQGRTCTISVCTLIQYAVEDRLRIPSVVHYLSGLVTGRIKLDGYAIVLVLYPGWWRRMSWLARFAYDCEHFISRFFALFTGDHKPCIHNPAPNARSPLIIPEDTRNHNRSLD